MGGFQTKTCCRSKEKSRRNFFFAKKIRRREKTLYFFKTVGEKKTWRRAIFARRVRALVSLRLPPPREFLFFTRVVQSCLAMQNVFSWECQSECVSDRPTDRPSTKSWRYKTRLFEFVICYEHVCGCFRIMGIINGDEEIVNSTQEIGKRRKRRKKPLLIFIAEENWAKFLLFDFLTQSIFIFRLWAFPQLNVTRTNMCYKFSLFLCREWLF